MRLRHFDWMHQIVLAVVVAVSCGATAFGQNAPPPVPAADGGESSATVAESPNVSAGNAQSCQSCQPWNGGNCQYCQPSRCSRWARCKAKQQAKWWGYPEEFEEIPFGSLTTATLDQSIPRGHQARMAVYHYDFVNGTEQLNASGRRRIARVASMSQAGWGPLVIEESADTELDQLRRANVLHELTTYVPGATGDSVVVGFPIGAGLNGVEGSSIYRSLMNQTGSRSAGGVGRNTTSSQAGSSQNSGSGSGVTGAAGGGPSGGGSIR